MIVTLLTKSGGLLAPINNLLGLIMDGIFAFFNLFGIQNIALSIIVFTFITRALMLPLTIKQQKFTKMSSRMNPELQKIQAKYKGKKDEASLKKQQIETQAVYEKYGANPTSGCLPLLITLPIMFALYAVINNIPGYVGQIKHMYEAIAVQIQGVSGYQDILATLAKTNPRIKVSDYTATNNIINVLSQLGTDAWNQLSANMPSIADSINSAHKTINHANSFFGLNISDTPGWKFPNILIPIIAAVLSFVQSKQVQVKTVDNKDNPAASAMNSMTYVMPLMQFFFCVTFPIGIGVYWIAQSVFAVIQQFFVNRYLDRMDVDELIQKSVAKAAKKRTKMQKNGISLEELAKKQTKSIEAIASEKTSKIEKPVEEPKEEVSEAIENEVISEKKTSSSDKKSITEIANLLKNKN
jgi:membrane protein insertase, YidC/Oxa1 family, C-terminal domain